MPAILNAANEAAVPKFLAGELRYPEIASTVRRVMDSFSGEIVREPSLSDILEASEEAKRRALA